MVETFKAAIIQYDNEAWIHFTADPLSMSTYLSTNLTNLQKLTPYTISPSVALIPVILYLFIPVNCKEKNLHVLH